jgi:hypothetical protein
VACRHVWPWHEEDALVLPLKLAHQRRQLIERRRIESLAILEDEAAVLEVMRCHIVGDRLVLLAPGRHTLPPIRAGDRWADGNRRRAGGRAPIYTLSRDDDMLAPSNHEHLRRQCGVCVRYDDRALLAQQQVEVIVAITGRRIWHLQRHEKGVAAGAFFATWGNSPFYRAADQTLAHEPLHQECQDQHR